MTQPRRHILLWLFWYMLTLVSAQFPPPTSPLPPPISSNYLEGFFRLQSTVPTGVRCGAKGSLKAANVLRDFIAGPNARDTCRNSCFSSEVSATCKSYAFHTDTNRCRLFRTSLVDQKFVTAPAAANVEFWSKECWLEDNRATTETWLTSDTSSRGYDDTYFTIVLPFTVSFCSATSNTVYMSVNGILSWQPPDYSYWNTALPARGTEAQYLPPTSIVAGWDELSINPNPFYPGPNRIGGSNAQWLSYKISGVGPQRTVSFHWRVGYTQIDGSTKGFLDSQVELYEARLGDASMFINDIGTDMGAGMTFGSQCLQDNNKYSQIAYNQPAFGPGDFRTYLASNGSWR